MLEKLTRKVGIITEKLDKLDKIDEDQGPLLQLRQDIAS